MNKQAEDIKAIREMMERSTKFLSLSGLSGVVAGVTALIGAAFAYFYLLRDPSQTDYNRMQEVLILLADALIVLAISIGFGIYFSWKKAKKNHQKLLNSVTKLVIYHLSIPLITGGIFSLVFLLRGNIDMVASATLIFYGIALVSASKYTFDEIHYLGLTEIVLGLLSAIFMYKGIIFWSIGFGLCHIFYGLAMYVKYDLKKNDKHNSTFK
jgi:preprotein translocase subunit YajC